MGGAGEPALDVSVYPMHIVVHFFTFSSSAEVPFRSWPLEIIKKALNRGDCERSTTTNGTELQQQCNFPQLMRVMTFF
jgi:hypothetical protein